MHLTMVIWGLMFCKIIGVIICSFVPIYSQLLKDFFVSQLVPLQIPCFEHFDFIPEFTNPYVVEFSVLRIVAGFFGYNAIKAGRMPISVYPLLKVPHVLDYSAEDTIFRIVLHSVCMGQFLSGLGFIGLGEGQSLR